MLPRLLLAVRKQRKWTQAQLAHELGVSARTIRDWEHDRAQPHPRYLSMLREMLNATLGDSGWAHLAALEQIRRDVVAGTITAEQAEAILVSLHAARRAIVAQHRRVRDVA